jgi:glycosyltransferase involved in cell wall biosynthesis
MHEISIITPSYGQLRWLKLCAASVADQADVDVEHLIQDAGTGAELREWAETRPGVRFFEEKDNGMYDAINRGFRRATGGIVAWLNCDEQYLPGALAKVRSFFRTHPEVDVLFGDALLVDEKGGLLSYRRTILPDLLHVRLSHLNTLSCATFVRRSVIERGFYLDSAWKTIADGVWVAAMLKARIPMAVLNEPLAAFTILESNLGQTAVARNECQRWREAEAAPPSWLRVPVVLLHRLRKFLHGAYAIRRVETELYTQDSPTRRKHIASRRLSFSWSRHHKRDDAGSP